MMKEMGSPDKTSLTTHASLSIYVLLM